MIKDGDGNKVYVSFNLSATEVADASAAQQMANNDEIQVSNPDGADRYLRFGNTVTNGPAGNSKDLGNADSKHINLDSTSVNSFYNSPNPQASLQTIYAAVSIHEIGHNLGGNHGDPGNMMTGATSLYNPGGGINNIEKTTYTLPSVNSLGIQALMGRVVSTSDVINNSRARYGQTSSRYLNDKQNNTITEGSVGRLVFAPNQ
ncbi:hypothetical protein [Empedobacter brevis]|uniref:hypothetical protein n=1 Tax=Empedobacter brevis TaxID=247 RepID=UPI002FE3B681